MPIIFQSLLQLRFSVFFFPSPGVMKLEATKFRPREVVKHVLQTAAASLQKELTLEGHVAEGVPVEVSIFIVFSILIGRWYICLDIHPHSFSLQSLPYFICRKSFNIGYPGGVHTS